MSIITYYRALTLPLFALWILAVVINNHGSECVYVGHMYVGHTDYWI